MKKLFFVFCAMNIVLSVQAQDAERKLAYDNYVKYSTQATTVKDVEKEASIKKYREGFNKKPYRYEQLAKEMKKSGQECLDLLGSDGKFTDLAQQEKKIVDEKMLQSKFTAQSDAVAKVVSEAMDMQIKSGEKVKLHFCNYLIY